jgi:hypothetical protein
MYLAIVIRDAFLHYLGEFLLWPLRLQQEVQEIVEQVMLRKGLLRQSESAKLTQQDLEDTFFGRMNFQVGA